MTAINVAVRQPHAVLPSRSCFSLSVPRLSDGLKLQMASSIGASIICAVTTTPLEVVKTRLQILPTSNYQGSCLPFTRSNFLFLDRPASEDLLRSRTGPMQMFRYILRNEGLRGLWTGTGATIIHALPSVSLYLTCYEQLKTQFEREGGIHRQAIPLLAGGLARIASVIVTCPLDVARTRKMAAGSTATTSRCTCRSEIPAPKVSLFSVMQQMVSQNGWRSLWRGMSATLWRDVPFSALYWTLAEEIRYKVQDLATSGQQSPIAGIGGTLYVNLVSGILAGTAASVVTQPFDLIKTRHMTTDVKSTTGWLGSENIFYSVQKTVAAEGISSLWKGLGLRLLKVPPSCAIVMASFEVLKRLGNPDPHEGQADKSSAPAMR